MAGSGFLTFTDGQVLTAAQVNGYLMEQAVMVFASSAARTSGIASPSEGMVTYLTDTNVLEYYTGSAWVSFVDVSGTQTLTNKTLTNPVINGAILDRTEENWNIVASAATGTINIDVLTASIWYYTTNATANHTINIRGDSGTTLSSLLAVGDSITVIWANTNGATAYYPTAFQIDGSSVTPKWQGGSAPAAGNASSIDIYSFNIVKTAATPTYTIFASQSQFK